MMMTLLVRLLFNKMGAVARPLLIFSTERYMDYKVMLSKSDRPDYILTTAYADAAGRGISPKIIQKLRKSYPDMMILEAIQALRNKSIDNPMAYLFKVLRNISEAKTTRLVVAQNGNFNKTIELFRAEKNREKPELRRPFNVEEPTLQP
jgi:hypothetical protein